jgi:hypothetical protein
MSRQWTNGAVVSVTVVTVALLLLVGLSPNQVAADVVIKGSSTTDNRTIFSATSWRELVRTTVTLVEGTNYNCAATGSATVFTPPGVSNRYIFGLSIDSSTAVPRGSHRGIELVDTPDVEKLTVVSSTFVFTGVPLGTHTIRWMAIKDPSTDANMVVADSSLSVICGH